MASWKISPTLHFWRKTNIGKYTRRSRILPFVNLLTELNLPFHSS